MINGANGYHEGADRLYVELNSICPVRACYVCLEQQQ